MSSFKKKKGLSRREMLKTTAALGVAGAAGIGANIVIPGRAKAAKKLTILQWNHFVPAYDEWFNKKWIKEWGEKNDTTVMVDNINNVQLPDRMAAEASAKKGHDLFMRLDLDAAPLMLGFILGPMLEENFRRAMLLSRGHFSVFIERPISGTLMALIAAFVAWQALAFLAKARRSRAAPA